MNEFTAPNVIQINLLYHYPVDQVFNAIFYACENIKKLQIVNFDKQKGIIDLYASHRRKSFCHTFRITISRIDNAKTNLTIAFWESLRRDKSMKTGKQISILINNISYILN